MKKVLWIIVCLMTMMVSVNAQSEGFKLDEWFIEHSEVDELKGIGGNEYFTYVVRGEGFITYCTNRDQFSVSAYKGMFDYDMYDYPKFIIIGIYDKDNKLVEKVSSKVKDFEVFGKYKDLLSINSKEINKKIWLHIKNNKGFVRFVIGRFNGNDFDIKVPCMKN